MTGLLSAARGRIVERAVCVSSGFSTQTLLGAHRPFSCRNPFLTKR